MTSLIDFFWEKASPKAIGVKTGLLAAVVGANFSLYLTCFLPLTNGTAYIELNVGYLPADLFAFAEAYGEAGRRLYIAMSCTLDVLTPFLGSLLLIWIAFYLGKRAGQGTGCSQVAAFALGVATCLSDWLENACMIALLARYPRQIMTVAVLARIFTALKYLFAVALIAAVVLCARGGSRVRK